MDLHSAGKTLPEDIAAGKQEDVINKHIFLMALQVKGLDLLDMYSQMAATSTLYPLNRTATKPFSIGY